MQTVMQTATFSGNDAVVLMRFLVHLENQLPVESA